MLSRYEAARVVGMRALQLSAGAPAAVHVAHPRLRCDWVYVATVELEKGVLDAHLQRPDGTQVHVSALQLPPEVYSVLDVRDGGRKHFPYG